MKNSIKSPIQLVTQDNKEAGVIVAWLVLWLDGESEPVDQFVVSTLNREVATGDKKAFDDWKDALVRYLTRIQEKLGFTVIGTKTNIRPEG